MTERLLVRDLMSVGVVTCKPTTPIAEVARLLLEEDLEGVIVLDTEGHASGVVSKAELVRAYSQDNCETLTAEEVMRADILQLPPDIPLAAAAQLMQDQGVRVAFMMHNAAGITYPAAVITYKHFLRHFAAHNDEELNDLGIKAARQSPIEYFIKKRDEARRDNQFPHQE